MRLIRRRHRRRAIAAAVVLVLLLAGGVVAWRQLRQRTECAVDPVAARELDRLADFTRWLAAGRARGYVGEVGWPSGPDSAAWNAVAGAWYRQADRDGLWVTAWTAGQWWPPAYPLAVYRTAADGGTTPGPQARVVEAHADAPTALRGVALAGGAFGTSEDGGREYSNAAPGRYGVDYHYDDAATYSHLGSRGLDIVRIAVTWERLQPRLGGPLAAAELTRLRAAVDAAGNAGLGVVLDLHNYGAYWVHRGHGAVPLTLGSPALPATALADLWRRTAVAFRGTPAVTAYGLMNEPRALRTSERAGAAVWEAASQRAVEAIRSTGDRRMITVAGYGGSSPGGWATRHPRPWVHDPARAIRYEAHQYFDADGSGHYALPYARERADAAATRPAPSCQSTVG
ncbi:MAG TPA: cellulase family glycosylhydrolase [Mycobacteriales bacterium]|nr:cellulase family glycosylhydrolase [Mycobacteriales bacterium]